MGGGLMQLVAYGAQDIYLTGNPQITFFKVVYRRHTNFAIECIQQTLNGTVGTGASTVNAIISRNGDLVSGMHLDIKFKTDTLTSTSYLNWTNNTGHAYIKEVSVQIGGQTIDKHYGHFLDVWNELTDKNGDEHAMLNKHSAKNAYLRSNTGTLPALQCYVPLKFWFNTNPGLALPLIALQYHEVKIVLSLRGTLGLINCDGAKGTGTPDAPDVQLWADYVYLDTDERRRFAQVSHEYLIEQLQYSSGKLAKSTTLRLNHPVKELIWTVSSSVAAGENTTDTPSDLDATANVNGTTAAHKNDYFNYQSYASGTTEVINGVSSEEPFDNAQLKLNGQDRFAKKKASYFRMVQPLQAGHKVPEKHIYCYSFALEPEEHQPSGTCNFSRIDNAQLNFTTIATANNQNLRVYATNYNVLRIMSGMGGLAYSN